MKPNPAPTVLYSEFWLLLTPVFVLVWSGSPPGRASLSEADACLTLWFIKLSSLASVVLIEAKSDSNCFVLGLSAASDTCFILDPESKFSSALGFFCNTPILRKEFSTFWLVLDSFPSRFSIRATLFEIFSSTSFACFRRSSAALRSSHLCTWCFSLAYKMVLLRLYIMNKIGFIELNWQDIVCEFFSCIKSMVYRDLDTNIICLYYSYNIKSSSSLLAQYHMARLAENFLLKVK